MHNEGVNLHSSAYPTSRFRSLVVDAQTATSATPLSDRQLEKLRAVFGRGVKKRNGRRLAGNPADFVNTLAGEFWVFLRFQSCTLSRITKSQL